MKVRLYFKTPDVLDDADIYDADGIDKEETDALIRHTADKFIRHEEYVTIELDTENETATVIPL